MSRRRNVVRPLSLLLAGLLIAVGAGAARAQTLGHGHAAFAHVSHHARAGQQPLADLAAQAGCDPSWVPSFGGLPGLENQVWALIVFDDGSGAGPSLFVGGIFETAGGVPGTRGLARWDGTSWSSLAGGMNGAVVALAVFDDGGGGGPALYATGGFSEAGGVAANGIARWDGSAWSPLGDGFTDFFGGTSGASTLAAFDDGSGPALYAGGSFLYAGGEIAHGLARWNGAAWEGFGDGLDSETIDALAVFDDGRGGGPALYIGGRFNVLGGEPIDHIARWDGSSFTEVGGGVGGGINPEVRCLTVVDLGGGPALYVGGSFATAGGSVMKNIAAWDGAHWRTLDGGIENSSAQPQVDVLCAYDDGSGLALYAGGRFIKAGGLVVNDIARWSGTSWSALDDGIDDLLVINDVLAMAVFDDGSGAGPRLHLGGAFVQASQVAANRLASWDGAAWSGVGTGAGTGPSDQVSALAVFDDGRGGGPALYVSGAFVSVGGVTVQHVAKWDGASWSALGEGLDGGALALEVFDDGLGGGPALYAGGYFGGLGTVARWDGAAWTSVGGPNTTVWDLAVFDDGNGGGPALYAVGDFTSAGAPGTQYIAKWDGVAWSSLSGSGMTGGYFTQQGELLWTDNLAVFDDGSGGGPALFVGGLFSKAGGVPASRIAKWDGQTWSALGSGLPTGYTFVDDLAVFDDGNGDGPALYATGNFTSIGGVSALGLGRWNGTSWSAVGSGASYARVLAVFDDGGGGGPALIAGGDFASMGGVAANSIARWDGDDWSALGNGMDDMVSALAVLDSGTAGGPALVAGGTFTVASDTGDSYIARWASCPVTPSPWHFEGYALAGVAGPPLLAGTGTLATGSSGTLALTHAKPSAFSVLFISLAGVSAPFKCGTLVPVPVSLQIPLFTNGAGSLPLGWGAWPGGLAGLSLHFQYAVQDPAALCGVALSNALRADVP